MSEPRTRTKYTYVRNNPLNFIDPNGLDCAYLNDAGTGAESIDHSSGIGECEQNGGYWANGWIANLSWVGTNPFNNNALIYSQFDNGGIGVSLASQTWTQGAFGLSDEASNSLYSFQQWMPMSYNQRAMLAIHNTLAKLPTVCGTPGLFASAEMNGGGFFGSVDANGDTSIAPIVGGERLGVTAGPGDKDAQLMVFVPVTEGTGVLIEPNMKDPFDTPTALGGYFGVPLGPPGSHSELAVGVYMEHPKIAGAYQCKN